MRYVLSPQWDFYQSLRERFDNQSVLEVGFGMGGGVLQYASKVNFVDAIELDPGAVDFAQKALPLANVNWIHSDICDYDTKTRYKFIVCIETLEHIPDNTKAVENMHRLLRKNGELFVSARNANADLRRWKDLHERELKAEEFHSFLADYFEEVELFDYSLKHKQDINTTLTPLLAVCKKKSGTVFGGFL
jgi:2-polyprenyl-3-methyl-5-hydroxy-6-metoxy-1,4-benzoquinol methylase